MPLHWLAIVARNLVPVVGVVALGWSAPHLIVSYFADTFLAMTTALALVLLHLYPPASGEGAEAHALPDLVSAFATAAAVAGVISIPLAGPTPRSACSGRSRRRACWARSTVPLRRLQRHPARCAASAGGARSGGNGRRTAPWTHDLRTSCSGSPTRDSLGR